MLILYNNCIKYALRGRKTDDRTEEHMRVLLQVKAWQEIGLVMRNTNIVKDGKAFIPSGGCLVLMHGVEESLGSNRLSGFAMQNPLESA